MAASLRREKEKQDSRRCEIWQFLTISDNFSGKAIWFVNGGRPLLTEQVLWFRTSGLVTEPGGPTQPGGRCGWQGRRPHPGAGETWKCGVWSAGQQAEVGPKESLTVTRLGSW